MTMSFCFSTIWSARPPPPSRPSRPITGGSKPARQWFLPTSTGFRSSINGWPAGYRQGGAGSRNARQNHDRNRVLPAERGISRRAIQIGPRLASEAASMAGLQAIGKVVRVRETPDKTTTETAYYLLSAALAAERFNEVVRQHWGVENRLHWRLDVVMNEDRDRTRLANGPHNLAVLSDRTRL